ncbi:hypothetical protein BLNAU_5061 [Blattamonas nauphoetae]|uniref:Uncharacterized protein n=1 Tax=Blattamonas nauphoetae TaxID=2049346 RepID=A0ABQ9Y850_9EUKA|nr:hypothetical protein BLNAU_5061 [Blattamonas nauphoetae]
MDVDGLTVEDVKLPQPIIFTTPTETTPPFSSLTNVFAHIIQSDQRYAFIYLHFDREVRGSYDFVVEERGKDVTFTVAVDSPATETETDEFVVVGDDRILTHDTTYTIKSILTTPGSESIPVLMSDAITFHIPQSSYVPPAGDEKKTLSAEMKKLLSWLIPLIASVCVALIAIIV